MKRPFILAPIVIALLLTGCKAQSQSTPVPAPIDSVSAPSDSLHGKSDADHGKKDENHGKKP
jgi:nitrous oxide reductase accessory protein NosL